MHLDFFKDIFQESSLGRIALIVAIVVGAHVAVLLLKRLGRLFSSAGRRIRHPKMRSVASLFSSIAVFALYFGAFGFILHELGVSLTTYLASASVIGLAVAFGSQGLVQDVVTGMTLVFSDLFDAGNMVEIGGQTGIIRSIGMRFIKLENALGAEVYIPNRSITSVVNYPRGYIRCIVDVQLSGDEQTRKAMEQAVQGAMMSLSEQLPGILLAPPSINGKMHTSTGKEILRVKFRVWPGRGAPIETTFRQELTQAFKALDAAYADWMISVYYEVEKPVKHRIR